MNGEILKRFYQLYYKEIYLYIYSLCKNKEVAEDLVQETFLKAILSLSDDHPNIRAWLYMVARNLFYNLQKKDSRTVPIEDFEDGASYEDHVLDEIIHNDSMKMLYVALGSLDVRKREILELMYLSHLSQKEIAKILNTTGENVRVLAYRAKKDLKKYMEDNHYDLS